MGDHSYFSLDFIKEAREQVSVIQSHLKAAQNHQKTYVDKRRRPLQFEVGDHVYLKVSPMMGARMFSLAMMARNTCTCADSLVARRAPLRQGRAEL